MRRREFINVIAHSAAAAAWSMAAHAQQAGPVRRIAVLMNTAANDQEGQEGVWHSAKPFNNLVGLLAEMCSSMFVGARITKIWLADTQGN